MKLNELKGTIIVIGRFSIRKVGIAIEVWSMSKTDKRDGTKVIEPVRGASHAYLTWGLQTIIRVGNKTEKVIAKKHLDSLTKSFDKIKTKNTDKYMDEYREIEGKYIKEAQKEPIGGTK